MSDKQPIAGGYLIAAVILGLCAFLVCGIFIGREIFRCPLSEPVDQSAWVADSLHLSTILQDKDRQIRELDSMVNNRRPEVIRVNQGIQTLHAQPDSVSRAILDREPKR